MTVWTTLYQQELARIPAVLVTPVKESYAEYGSGLTKHQFASIVAWGGLSLLEAGL